MFFPRCRRVRRVDVAECDVFCVAKMRLNVSQSATECNSSGLGLGCPESDPSQ